MTATALATRDNSTTQDFSREQIDLIKQTVARDTTDAQLKLFLYRAQAYGLDPLLGQIHAVVRKQSMAIQVGIDGLRLIAARTREYVGNEEPVFEERKPRLDEDVKGRTVPSKATITVWRRVDGERCGFTDSAYWDEFYPGDGPDGFMWRKLPHVMLGKVAESRALRKAFPHETSGLFVDEEMHQAERALVQDAQPAPIRMVNAVTAEVGLPAEPPPLDYKATLTWIQKLPQSPSAKQRDALARLCEEKLPAEAERYGLALPTRAADMDPAAWAVQAVMTLAERDDSQPF